MDVVVDADKNGEDGDLMKVEKGLIKGVTDGGRRMKQEKDHGKSADGAKLDKGVVPQLLAHHMDSRGIDLIGHPGRRVDDRLEHDDPTDPAMEQIVRVEADPEQSNQGVVSARQDE